MVDIHENIVLSGSINKPAPAIQRQIKKESINDLIFNQRHINFNAHKIEGTMWKTQYKIASSLTWTRNAIWTPAVTAWHRHILIQTLVGTPLCCDMSSWSDCDVAPCGGKFCRRQTIRMEAVMAPTIVTATAITVTVIVNSNVGESGELLAASVATVKFAGISKFSDAELAQTWLQQSTQSLVG